MYLHTPRPALTKQIIIMYCFHKKIKTIGPGEATTGKMQFNTVVESQIIEIQIGNSFTSNLTSQFPHIFHQSVPLLIVTIKHITVEGYVLSLISSR